MGKPKVVVIEDDEDILDLIAYNLERDGYAVLKAQDGSAGLKTVGRELPDLVILDLMLPEINGLEVCRRIKMDEKLKHIPVIMVTAKGEEVDIVAGLELGADDYIAKPFRPRELVARTRAVLRRGVSRDAKPLVKGAMLNVAGLTIDPGRREVLWNGKAIELTFTEFEILYVLASRPGWVFSRYQIVDAVRGDDYPVTDRSVDVQIVGLRKKLKVCARHIETVRGVGYRFTESK